MQTKKDSSVRKNDNFNSLNSSLRSSGKPYKFKAIGSCSSHLKIELRLTWPPNSKLKTSDVSSDGTIITIDFLIVLYSPRMTLKIKPVIKIWLDLTVEL